MDVKEKQRVVRAVRMLESAIQTIPDGAPFMTIRTQLRLVVSELEARCELKEIE